MKLWDMPFSLQLDITCGSCLVDDLSTGAGKCGTHFVMVMEDIINGHTEQLLHAIIEMTKLTSVFEFLGTCRKNQDSSVTHNLILFLLVTHAIIYLSTYVYLSNLFIRKFTFMVPNLNIKNYLGTPIQQYILIFLSKKKAIHII